MTLWLRILAVVAWGVGVGGAAAREETIPLTEKRGISVQVPDGFNFKSGVNAKGELAMTLEHAKERLSLHVTFEADPEEAFRQPRARKERLHEEFKSYVEGSREKAMQFDEFATRVGAATICVFTDDKLLGKQVSEYPPGEYLHLTVGVKAWPGVVATFTLFSNDLKSANYEAVMHVLRDSVHEKPAPLL